MTQVNRKMRKALTAALRLCDEALPKFNWAASALDANAIQLLNEVPGQIREALGKALVEEAKEKHKGERYK